MFNLQERLWRVKRQTARCGAEGGPRRDLLRSRAAV